MNSFYHKVAVTSVCVALGFVLGASEEVKAATITLTPTIQFGIHTRFNRFGASFSALSPRYDLVSNDSFRTAVSGTRLAEFNISSFFLAPNTIIRSAVFQDKISSFWGSPPFSLGIFGYIGNGTAELSDLSRGVFLSSVEISSLSPGDTLNFDVTTFVNQRVSSNGNPFAGFSIRTLGFNRYSATLGGTDALGRSSLVIETVDAAEPVPEPTTIFSSAIGLSLGGWLKRKKSSQQNKTTPQR
ncbi:MAG: PEP-CTERM sorting domain-containing protein [Microcoleus sp. T1-bin1]|nr:PEP-CTERM sorting domain-containing protein [Nitrososphaera sp.]MBD0306628.1 PEP-CTERM sorting domain-containing protein [Microcoleus sp. T1-bin1]MBD0339324.1 PEP-CTERM sorting domain-containing protein [Microcoleus sp. Co-bin12]